ncbi:MAG TPA: secretin N-terminal domain-containing protein [Tepidisphaeraceae bacterium]|jgi:type II secretion system protein D|nr:secretin N-terminal domain-containing protein [Tepidisphaeraceae bacterium]
MKRSRSCAVLLAASAAICVIAPDLCSAPAATQPANAPAATIPATTPSPATTPPATSPATVPATTEAATQPSTTQAAATQPADADHPPAQIRLNFRDTPLDTILEHLSQDAGFSIERDVPGDVRVTVISLQPLTPAQAVTLLNTVLAGNGMAAVQNGRILHIIAREKAKKGNLPVHFGNDPAQVEATDALITQVIPVHNVDAVKLRQDLTPLVGTDADMTANAGSNAIVMTDTSANIRRIVQIVSILDKREGTTSEVKIIALKNASAPAAAKLVLSIFRPEEPRPPRGGEQQQQQQQHREGMLLGTGVDQALHGGKVTAAADERTNSVIVAAPSETLKAIEAMLQEIDQNPATVATPSIKTFHLKVADAQAVAHALRAVFQQPDEPQAGQSHQLATDEAINSHVTVVYEPHTNTLIVTAPPAALVIVEALIRDVDHEQPTNTSVRSFPLKFADAVTTAKVIQSVFVDPSSGLSRVASSVHDKVSATADARTNTIFVTATSDEMAIVEKTIRDLDASPTAGSEVKFYRLKQGDADATAKLIMSFFKSPESSGEKRPPDAVHVGVNAVADSRTNTVAVTAPPEALAVIDQIVHEVENDPSTAFEIETFTLKNADAEAAAKLLGTVFQPDTQSSAKSSGKDQAVKAKVVAAADDRTNSVVVTAPAETLKVIESIMKMLDATPVTDAQIQVFTLKNADAEVAGDLLESIFAPKALQTTGSSSTTPKAPGVLDAQRKLGWITTTSDERTNTLIVTAPPTVLKAVAGIINQIDSSPGTQETFFMYRLRNAQAANLQGVLNQLFGNTQLGGTAANTANGQNGQQRNGQQVAAAGTNGTGGLGGSNSMFGGTGLRGLTAGSSTSAGGTGIGARYGTISGPPANGAAMPQLSAGSTRVLSELSGQVFVVADLDTNSLLVTTATRYEKEVRSIITELDRPVPQVLIKVLVAEVTHEDSADWGTDFSVLNRRANGNGTTVAQTLGNGAAAAANGGLIVGLVENNVNATLHALATEGKLDVLSRPYILASDNQLASITVGQEVPFITNTQITDTGQQINTIQYQDIGIILNVTPHINPEGLVILDVAPEISQLSASTVPIGAGVAAPIIDKRSAQSRVGIKNGSTIVIGGLMQDNKTLTISKIPILGDIPLIGGIFSRTQVDKTKTELLIFLTPHVAQQPDTLDPMTADELNGTRLTPGAVGPGVFDEHMKGMHRGHTPETLPTTQPIDPVIEFNSPTTQPATGPIGSGPIPLP